MQQYKLSLSTLSNVLISSGKSSTLIDADIEFHKNGFPFIKARTLKGLLKESVEEVCEIENKNEIRKILYDLFGEGGTDKSVAKLRFDNLYLPDWELLKKEVKQTGLAAHQVTKQYTNTIQQTAIDKNEIAKDTSLRNYRVLKPNLVFEGLLEISSSEYDDTLNKAILNLRYAGSRRNRGFGRIRITTEKIEASATVVEKVKITDETKLSVKLTAAHPIVLGLKFGDQNTVNTQTHLSGNQLKGLIIGMYLKEKMTVDKKEFYDLFISGKLQFNYLYFNNSKAVPLNIHYKKSIAKDIRKPLNIFGVDGEITKPYGGMVSELNGIYAKEIPDTTLFFHNSRENRTAGKSTEDQEAGSIFYYEALDEDQSFEGSIEGDAALLKILSNYLPKNFETNIGKSRSAQYGKIKVVIAPQTGSTPTIEIAPDISYIIKLETPLLLFNENGFPEYSDKTFTGAVTKKFRVAAVEQAAAGFIKIEQYNQIWQGKSGKMDACKEGSVFVIKANEAKKIETVFYMGEWNEQGFGKCSIEKYNPAIIYQIKDKNRDSDKEKLVFKPTHPDLKTIQQIADAEASLLTAKRNALALVKNNKKYKGIKNHLISRLIFAFENKTKKTDFENFIKKLKDKPAGEALKKHSFCDPDGNFKLDAIRGADSYEIQKPAWLLLLKTLRKNN
jgi:CRISPR-associated protein Csx10